MHSVEKRVIKSFLVPNAVPVEDKNPIGLRAPEYHISVNTCHSPQEVVADSRVVDLFKSMDVDEVALVIKPAFGFCENYLLGVGK